MSVGEARLIEGREVERRLLLLLLLRPWRLLPASHRINWYNDSTSGSRSPFFIPKIHPAPKRSLARRVSQANAPCVSLIATFGVCEAVSFVRSIHINCVSYRHMRFEGERCVRATVNNQSPASRVSLIASRSAERERREAEKRL